MTVESSASRTGTKKTKTKAASKPKTKAKAAPKPKIKAKAATKPKTKTKAASKPKTKTSPKVIVALPKKAPKAPQAVIVPIDPKTGKPTKKPQGKEVFYALLQAGKLTRLPSAYAQKFSKRDLDGLNASLRASGPKHFVVYEEMTANVIKDKKGNTVFRTKGGRPLRDSNRNKIPLKKTKLTYAKAKKAQKPILIAGKKSRALDIGFQERKKRDRPRITDVINLATKRKVWSQEIALQGDTLKEAFSHVPLNMSLAEFKKTDGLSARGRLKVRGEVISFRTTVDTLANFSQDVGAAARRALANQGMTFTSLVTLEEFVEEEPNLEDVLMYVGKDAVPAEDLEEIGGDGVSAFLSVEPL